MEVERGGLVGWEEGDVEGVVLGLRSDVGEAVLKQVGV